MHVVLHYCTVLFELTNYSYNGCIRCTINSIQENIHETQFEVSVLYIKLNGCVDILYFHYIQ